MDDKSTLDALKHDSILETVILKYCERAHAGHERYGKTMDRDDLKIEEWIDHLMEELMDATLYLEKLKVDLKTRLRVYNVHNPDN